MMGMEQLADSRWLMVNSGLQSAISHKPSASNGRAKIVLVELPAGFHPSPEGGDAYYLSGI